MESSLCEKPERHASRRLSDHLAFEGQKQKVHSLVDKVYARKNLHLAWERVRANRGTSGTDRITIEEFEANLEANLERLHRELRDDTYQPLPVRRLEKKIQRGKGQFKLAHDRIKSKLNRQNLYAIPTQKSVDRFKDQIRALTKRCIPLRLGELIKAINPIIRGWGHYYCRAQVRTRFRQLDGWIVRRLWSHRAKRWRNAGWKKYPTHGCVRSSS
jgi:hypothetical protein